MFEVLRVGEDIPAHQMPNFSAVRKQMVDWWFSVEKTISEETQGWVSDFPAFVYTSNILCLPNYFLHHYFVIIHHFWIVFYDLST